MFLPWGMVKNDINITKNFQKAFIFLIPKKIIIVLRKNVFSVNKGLVSKQEVTI